MSGLLLSIDPGSTESGYAILNPDYSPVEFGKADNYDLLRVARFVQMDRAVLELVGHYGTGMPAGKTVFDTCRWIGRYEQVLAEREICTDLVLRVKVKTHLCGQARANDANVTQALVDRFTPGQKNYGKGTKAEPGWFHGFKADAWSAYALGVYALDKIKAGEQP